MCIRDRAKEAAKEFVDKVIGEDGQPVPQTEKSGGGMAMLHRRVDLWSVLGVGSAYAQATPDITINTPAIRAIQSSMEQRFNSTLRAGFDAGALGFSSDGPVSYTHLDVYKRQGDRRACTASTSAKPACPSTAAMAR